MQQEQEQPENLTRRKFLQTSALATGGAAVCLTLGFPEHVDGAVTITGDAWPSVNGWEHRTVMHYLNTIFPGDNNKQLFYGDSYPLKSGGDYTGGAWSAAALDVFYDPYYGIAGTNSNLIASALDWAVRTTFDATYFYKANQFQQLEAVDRLTDFLFTASGFQGAASLCMAAVLGAFKNKTGTSQIGWPGPNGGYYDSAKYPVTVGLKPVRMTVDGNLP
jgi:hypothetical protein